MLYSLLVKINKEENIVEILPVDDNDEIKKELFELLTSNINYFIKSFEINIEIDEMNKNMKSTITNLDHEWTKTYKKLTAGSIFMLIHSMADYINGIEWTETYTSCN